MKKQLLVLLTAAAMIMTGCNSSDTPADGNSSEGSNGSNNSSQIVGEGWGEEIKAEMMQYLGEVLPFVQLDENTLEYGYFELFGYGVYSITDESPTDLLQGYGDKLVAAGYEKETEDDEDYYVKGDLEVMYGWSEAEDDYPAGNAITVYFPPYQEPITEEYLIEEGYSKVLGWPTQVVTDTIEGSGITLPSIKDEDEWFVATQVGSNDYGTYNCAFLATHSLVAEEYAQKLAAIGITYDEEYEAYYDEEFAIEIDMSENNGFTLIDIYGPYLDDTPEIVANDNSFVKISSLEELVDGDYAIVCESQSVMFAGYSDPLDSTENILDIEIASNSFGSSNLAEMAMFTITKTDDGYTVKSQYDEYIYQEANKNSLSVSESPVALEITFETNGDAKIVGGSNGTVLRFNAANDQQRFRFYKASSYAAQEAVQLYKFVEAE